MGKHNRRKSNNGKGEGDGPNDSSVYTALPVNQRYNEPSSVTTSAKKSTTVATRSSSSSSSDRRRRRRRSFYQWCLRERQGITWVVGCMLLGCLFGFGVGSDWFIGEHEKSPSKWKINLGGKIRSNPVYRHTIGRIPITRKISSIDGERGSYFSENKKINKLIGFTKRVLGVASFFSGFVDFQENASPFSSDRGIPSIVVKKKSSSEVKTNPSHPYVYAVLREAVAREKGGYVHPDLGFMEPAPCGAARGVGMVRNIYHRCQTRCVPGTAEEKLEAKTINDDNKSKQRRSLTTNEEPKEIHFLQEEVLIKVPLSYQMTRKVALNTLLPRIMSESQRKTVHELDDAALLVLLLAHERGVGQYSRWLPYISSLPLEPSCGYSQNLRPYLLDTINVLRDEVGMDVNGWPGELIRATEYSERIVTNLSNDYGNFLQTPKGMSTKTNIRWALCQVASRATGGFLKHGALRMIPLIDMLNHDAHAGGFVELTGEERLEKGDFVESISEEFDGGTFVVRSLRHGRRKALRMGQELLVNYNVPHYSALDWMVSSGFVPPERFQNWQKLDAPLPRVRRDGPFSNIHEMGRAGRKKNYANSN